MGKSSNVPDAWDDDDWETQADRDMKEAPCAPDPDAPMTRAERLAKHAEEQRRLWESAEAPGEPTFLPTNNPVPLATPFKPAVKVLSRKPAPKMIARRDPITGLEQLTLQDDDEDEAEQKKQETPEEIRRRQQRELQEKQRRYEETRAKIFGESNPSSGQSTPGNVTPPEGRSSHRGRGRGRGGGGGGGRGRDRDNGRQDRRQPANPQPSSDTRELYDPSYSPKPGYNIQRRGGASPQLGSRSGTPREEDQIIRAPRGPDGSGKGFGFARRGAEQD
ncbi:hypothetical protein BT67DRAFT_385805 [Trichocladium antarcticum]|uniref:SUZ domain-containing protein n=1 Tax=Trichocladium antarcticum TaxID=1450529 RepID=A0AAN6ZBR0_9PEZI|nr:hypothetical protein BT67DRAFT_385805 [Trichocladium antarcticum]